jgi:hypothetical protein
VNSIDATVAVKCTDYGSVLWYILAARTLNEGKDPLVTGVEL